MLIACGAVLFRLFMLVCLGFVWAGFCLVWLVCVAVLVLRLVSCVWLVICSVVLSCVWLLWCLGGAVLVVTWL